jgi:hypothetical protein
MRLRNAAIWALVVLAACATVQAQTAAPAAPKRATRPATPEGMTNADVLKLVRAGLGEPLVVVAIRNAKKTAFDLSTDRLIELKGAGVSDGVLAVMLDPTAAPVAATPVLAASAPEPTPDLNDPAAPHESGIYIDDGSGKSHLVLLEPTVFKRGKSGGTFTSAMTMGIKKMKWKAVVGEKHAAIRTRTTQPVFYFYFDAKGSSLGSTGGAATNPSQFLLARMSASDKGRELVVGEAGALGASSGTREKDTVEFRAEKVGPGVYRVQPSAAVQPGEYCFFKAEGSATMGAGSSGNLYAFGIDG